MEKPLVHKDTFREIQKIDSDEITILDIGMTIICDDEGKFQIQHWPPLPVDDSIAIMNILQVRASFFILIL